MSEVFAAGQIFEIGSRGRVLEHRAGELVVELGGDAVSCRADQVVVRHPRCSRAAAWAPSPAFG